MKRVMTLCVLVLTLTMALCPAALAADLGSAATAAQVCYPSLDGAAHSLRLSFGAHQHEPAVGRDFPQPCAQGQTEVDAVIAVLGDLQQCPGGQMAADGHIRVGIVRLIAQLYSWGVPHFRHQALSQRCPPHNQEHSFQPPHLPYLLYYRFIVELISNLHPTRCG